MAGIIISIAALFLAAFAAPAGDVEKPDFVIAFTGDIQANLVECG